MPIVKKKVFLISSCFIFSHLLSSTSRWLHNWLAQVSRCSYSTDTRVRPRLIDSLPSLLPNISSKYESLVACLKLLTSSSGNPFNSLHPTSFRGWLATTENIGRMISIVLLFCDDRRAIVTKTCRGDFIDLWWWSTKSVSPGIRTTNWSFFVLFPGVEETRRGSVFEELCEKKAVCWCLFRRGRDFSLLSWRLSTLRVEVPVRC